MGQLPPDAYDGREHAEVKHYLLKSYLQRYLLILGRTRQRLGYVDAFSGPWKSATDDHTDTSFGLAWETAEGCVETLASQGKYPHVRQLWIEGDEGAYARLAAFAATKHHRKLSVETVSGKFEENVEAIASWIGEEDAFVLIDPKGYAGLIEPDVLAPLLAKPRVEVLINYMWQFIDYAARQMNQPGNLENLRRIFGDACTDIERIADAEERERRYLEQYEARLRASGIADGPRRSRVLSFPIHHVSRRDRAKYYLVYATHSSKGLITFAESADGAAGRQAEVHFETHHRKREAKSGIADIFGGGVAQVDATLTEPWLAAMPAAGAELRVDEEVWASLIERYRCRPSELMNGLKELISGGIIVNVDAKRPRRSKFVHYDENELLRRLK